jgi:hypothetical protein
VFDSEFVLLSVLNFRFRRLRQLLQRAVVGERVWCANANGSIPPKAKETTVTELDTIPHIYLLVSNQYYNILIQKKLIAFRPHNAVIDVSLVVYVYI